MDFSKLFNQFNSEDSLFILLFMLIAFFFGLLLGYLLRSRRVVELRRELRDKKKELDDKQAEVDTLQEELALKEADIKKAGFATQEAEARAERIEAEKAELHKQIFQLNQELDEAKSSSHPNQDLLEEKDRRIAALEAQLADQEEDPEVVSKSFVVQDIDDSTRTRLRVLEERMDELTQENEVLRQSVSNLSESSSSPVVTEVPSFSEPIREKGLLSVHPMPGLPDAEVVEEEPDTIFARDKAILGEKIILEDVEKDDLTRIDGIGTFLEQKLNEIGVFTYEEISTWDSTRIAAVTEDIGHFEGRIEKDDWVGQAAQLALKKQENPDAFVKEDTFALATDPEDLKIVEGIGPKIEQLLKDAGIQTWEDLAEADTSRLRSILEEAGPAYKMHDPETWPAQARLAHTGEWKILSEYQNELIGGRDLG